MHARNPETSIIAFRTRKTGAAKAVNPSITVSGAPALGSGIVVAVWRL